MKSYELGALLFILFLLSLVTSTAVNHAAAQIYPENIQNVPPFNPNCVRYLPQFSELKNAAFVVSCSLGVFKCI